MWGVYVMCSPDDNKRDVKWACNDLLNRKLLDGVCIVDGALMRANPSFTDHLCREMGSMWSDKISNLIRDGDKYGIVIEDFDKCMKKDGNATFEEFVVSLAEESVGWKKFSVLLTMCDYDLAMNVLKWNSGEKMYKSLLL